MLPSVIRRRLAKALKLQDISSIYEQRRNPTRTRRRSRPSSGGCKKVICSVSWSPEVLQRVKDLSSKLMIERSIIVNDALDFYCAIAEQEFVAEGHLSGADIIPTTLSSDKVRRPDGAIVNLYDSDPQAHKPERQKQRKG